MKIAVLSSHTASLFWFRLEMMKAFIEKGHTVVALGSDSEDVWREKFGNHNIGYKQLNVERNGLNLWSDVKTFIELYGFIKEEMPDKVFAYQAKTVIYGSLAAKANGLNDIYILIAGLGSVFRGSGIKNSLVKMVMKTLYKVACKSSNKVFFQNNDDRQEFITRRLVKKEKTVIINGSGVNLEKFKPAPLPIKPCFLFIGRLLKDKGVIEYLEACRELKLKYPEIRCMLVGPYDTNPSGVKPDDLDEYINASIIEYYGQQEDVRPFIEQCSTFILPSYHEGRPKTVLEAMAMGRAIITTNAPGCRETVKNEVNGYLVPVRDVDALKEKMEYLMLNPNTVKRMGEKSIKIAIEKYDVKIVNNSIMKTMELIQ